jgi:hypothetical protein
MCSLIDFVGFLIGTLMGFVLFLVLKVLQM